MRANPNKHWNRLFEKIKPNVRSQTTSNENDSPLVLIVREFSLETVRRKLLSRCVMFQKLGISLCLASVISLIFGYLILAMGFILLGSGITLFSELWKRYLPKSINAKQSDPMIKESDLTNTSPLSTPVVLPLLSRDQKQETVSFASSVTPLEIEQFFNSSDALPIDSKGALLRKA